MNWFTKLNPRERMLALIVAATIFALINLFLWGALIHAGREMRAEVNKRKLTRREQTIYLREAELWGQREQWLAQHQPPFRGAADASTLLDQVKQIAGKYNIVLENPAIGTGDSTAACQSVFASVDTRSPWQPLVHFLYDLQTPESFIVFENARLEVDPGDATQMHGKFKIARWSAPASVAQAK